MRLSELRPSGQHRQTQNNTPQQQGELGTIRHATTFTRPIEGLYQGNPVILIATGDIIGMSPAVQIVERNGHLDWVSSDDVVVTQREFRPQSEQQLQELYNRSRQSAGALT